MDLWPKAHYPSSVNGPLLRQEQVEGEEELHCSKVNNLMAQLHMQVEH